MIRLLIFQFIVCLTDLVHNAGRQVQPVLEGDAVANKSNNRRKKREYHMKKPMLIIRPTTARPLLEAPNMSPEAMATFVCLSVEDSLASRVVLSKIAKINS
jgi:hypothetical protein